MLRILRLPKKSLDRRAEAYTAHASLWREEILRALGSEIGSFLPLCEIDEDYVHFLTPLEGSLEEVREEELNGPLQELVKGRRQELLAYLKGSTPLGNPTLETQRQEVARLFEFSSRLYLMDHINPVLLPAISEQELAAALNPAVAAATDTAAKRRGCLLPLLLFLLLLLALLSLWWFLLRPWPQEGTLQERLYDLYKTYLAADTKEQEQLLAGIRDRSLKLIAEQEQAERERLEALEVQRKAEEEARRLAEEERRKAEEERLSEAIKAKEEAERERLEALEAQKKAEEEARRLKEEAAKSKIVAPKPAETVPPQSKSTAEPQGSKALPKCTTLRQQGKLPKMVVAFDGSESMLTRDVTSFKGRQSRLQAATTAASNMVKSVDKNVQIGLVEINGCQAAKNRGFFSGAQRQNLMRTINGINPLAYDGKTPLVDGLNKLSEMVDGVNAEAVGVLISDGEDTCTFTQNIDICSLARKIHAKKPKLKIHTILIGKNASKAACVARITGGKVFSPQNASQINAQLQEAGAEYKQVCKD